MHTIAPTAMEFAIMASDLPLTFYWPEDSYIARVLFIHCGWEIVHRLDVDGVPYVKLRKVIDVNEGADKD